ncbi:MAG TPA: hypothetical protein VFL94_14955 [Actinomycetales bacterium]|nr:hypothetical protein [Actinomycetales bacterium]
MVTHVGPVEPRRVARRRIWVQHVAVDADKLELRVRAARARGGLTPAQQVVADGVDRCVQKARAAAFREDPVPGRLANWWRGTLVEAAYRNMHTARAQLIDLMDADELRAEIPMVVARANAVLHRDDPRRLTVEELQGETVEGRRALMRRLVGDSYEKLDLEHAQLRSFRNILLFAAVFTAIITAGTIYFVSRNPSLMPLCFDREVPTDVEPLATTVAGKNCPTGSGADVGPAGSDILVVAALGALGGALAATLSIRNLKGTSTPYDVPVALAFLKVPLGALTAILALVAIQGDFVPGLSILDSQGQILAYALVFGFAQQALSRLLDQRAQSLLEGLPGGEATEPAPPGAARLLAPVMPVAPVVPVVPVAPVVPPASALSATAGATPTGDRPVAEPEDATQQDQLALLRETGNDRQDVDEAEEARLLEAEFGPPDAQGVYGAPAASKER